MCLVVEIMPFASSAEMPIYELRIVWLQFGRADARRNMYRRIAVTK